MSMKCGACCIVFTKFLFFLFIHSFLLFPLLLSNPYKYRIQINRHTGEREREISFFFPSFPPYDIYLFHRVYGREKQLLQRKLSDGDHQSSFYILNDRSKSGIYLKKEEILENEMGKMLREMEKKGGWKNSRRHCLQYVVEIFFNNFSFAS